MKLRGDYMVKEYIRWANITVKNALSTRRIVSISGARQTGKTTLTKQAVSKDNIFAEIIEITLE